MNTSKRCPLRWPPRLGIGLAAGLPISLIDNFTFAGEVSPIVIVTLLLIMTYAAVAKWGRKGGPAAAGLWLCIPSPHLVKHALHLPDTLHPNTYASILMLAIFSSVIAVIGVACGALSRKLLLGGKSEVAIKA